jgi:hypothetical protein
VNVPRPPWSKSTPRRTASARENAWTTEERTMKPRVIEVLYTDRCPHLVETIQRVRDAITTPSRSAEVELHLILVGSPKEASQRGFVGSPTVRVDGEDVEPNAPHDAFGLQDRAYMIDGQFDHAPASAWISSRLG